MDHLTRYPPEILTNIIGNDYDIWLKLRKVNRSLYHLTTVYEKPLRNRFKQWAPLAYLKFVKAIFNENKEIILEKVLRLLPKEEESLPIFLELIKITLEKGFEYVFEYLETKFSFTAKNDAIITFLTRIIRRDNNHEKEVFRFISPIAKERLAFDMYKEGLKDIQNDVLKKLIFSRLKKHGFKNSIEIHSRFVLESNKKSFDEYATATCISREKILIEVFEHATRWSRDQKLYTKLAKKSFAFMGSVNVVIFFTQGHFDGLRSADFIYDLVRKFLEYSDTEKTFTALIMRMDKKNMKYTTEIARRIIMNRKSKITFVIAALQTVYKKDINMIKDNLVNDRKISLDNKIKLMERIQNTNVKFIK